MTAHARRVERIVAGLEKKNRLPNAREREVVAHHEMGHALVAAALPGCDPVHKISIIPRGIGADRARAIRVANRGLLDEGARALLGKETLGGGELAGLLARVAPEAKVAAA